MGIDFGIIFQSVLTTAIVGVGGVIISGMRRAYAKRDEHFLEVGKKLDVIEEHVVALQVNDAGQNETLKEVNIKLSYMMGSIASLIRYRIKKIAEHAEADGRISDLEYKTAHAIYKQYHELGGNGEIDGYINKIDNVFKASKIRV